MVWKLPTECLKFVLNAAQDTIPHNSHLSVWRREAGLSAQCKLCGQWQTLLHILNNCETAFAVTALHLAGPQVRTSSATAGRSPGEDTFSHSRQIPRGGRTPSATASRSPWEDTFSHSWQTSRGGHLQPWPADPQGRTPSAIAGRSPGEDTFSHSRQIPKGGRTPSVTAGRSPGEDTFSHSQQIPRGGHLQP